MVRFLVGMILGLIAGMLLFSTLLEDLEVKVQD